MATNYFVYKSFSPYFKFSWWSEYNFNYLLIQIKNISATLFFIQYVLHEKFYHVWWVCNFIQQPHFSQLLLQHFYFVYYFLIMLIHILCTFTFIHELNRQMEMSWNLYMNWSYLLPIENFTHLYVFLESVIWTKELY